VLLLAHLQGACTDLDDGPPKGGIGGGDGKADARHLAQCRGEGGGVRVEAAGGAACQGPIISISDLELGND